MKRKGIIFLLSVLAMALVLTACNSQGSQTVPSSVEETKTMTINSFDIEITHVPYAKYQVDILSNCDYYTDALEEPDSPQFVFIAPASKSVYRDVTDIQIDDSQNVTITVREINAGLFKELSNPITVVSIYPFPASITVIDEHGNTLNGK